MPQNFKKAVVMQILPKLESGGVERGTVDMAKALMEAGFKSIVISAGGSLVYQLEEAGVKHLKLPVNSKNPITIYNNIARIAKLIKEYQVDIVHVRSRAPAWSAYYACRQTACKLVSTFHGTYSTNLPGWHNSSLKLLYNGIMLKSDLIIAVSEFVKQHILQTYPFTKDFAKDKICVIHRGADLDHFCPEKISQNRTIELIKSWNLPEDKQIILFPARISKWKGYEFLIKALAQVKNPDFFCVMVGSSSSHKKYRQELVELIKSYNLPNKIKLIEAVKDMATAYKIANLIISASTRPEAFGRIAIEAGAMGRIVIATNIGGSLETIIDGQTGFLVEPNNIEQMANKIDYLLNMSFQERNKIGHQARIHIENNFSNQKMCERTISLYKKLLTIN